MNFWIGIFVLIAIAISTAIVCDTIEKKQVVVYKTVYVDKPFTFPPGCEFYLVKTGECIPYPR